MNRPNCRHVYDISSNTNYRSALPDTENRIQAGFAPPNTGLFRLAYSAFSGRLRKKDALITRVDMIVNRPVRVVSRSGRRRRDMAGIWPPVAFPLHRGPTVNAIFTANGENACCL